MPIRSLTIPEGFEGLAESKLMRLGAKIVLAGPNGSGKSRVLRSVADLCSGVLTEDDVRMMQGELAQVLVNQAGHQDAIETAENDFIRGEYRRSVDHFGHQAETLRKTIAKAESIDFVSNSRGGKPVVVMYMPRASEPRNPATFMQSEINGLINTTSGRFGFDDGGRNVFGLIDGFVKEARLAQPFLSTSSNARELVRKLDRLDEMLESLVGSRTGWDPELSRVTMFGRPMNPEQLSEGQRILATIATSIALQDGRLEDLVLLLDEPEVHLHPKALTHLLRRLDDACPSAQIWIATHSVHVIANVGVEFLWAVERGRVSHAGSQWHKVVGELVGGEDDAEAVRTLLGEPARAAIVKFTSECVRPPNVASTPPGDPQTTQIVSAVQVSGGESARPIRIIDFGMGEGRLLSELAANHENLSSVIDYRGVDVDDIPPARKARCISLLEQHYSEGASSRLILGDHAIPDHVNAGTVDLVVMCNVLHEISPADWIQLLGQDGPVFRCLRDSGSLLIAEDQRLPEGENAHDFGFLVFDRAELKALFALEPEDQSIVSSDHPDPKYAGRLKLHLVPRDVLAGISQLSRLNALRVLRSSASRKATEALRVGTPQSGREFAFWCVQHFNASRAIESLRH